MILHAGGVGFGIGQHCAVAPTITVSRAPADFASSRPVARDTPCSPWRPKAPAAGPVLELVLQAHDEVTLGHARGQQIGGHQRDSDQAGDDGDQLRKITRRSLGASNRYPKPRTVTRNAGSSGFFFNLLPQPADVDVHRSRSDEMLLAPDLAQQLLARPRVPRMRDEKLEQLELGGGQFDFALILINAPRAEIHTERTGCELGLLRLGVRIDCAADAL